MQCPISDQTTRLPNSVGITATLGLVIHAAGMYIANIYCTSLLTCVCPGNIWCFREFQVTSMENSQQSTGAVKVVMWLSMWFPHCLSLLCFECYHFSEFKVLPRGFISVQIKLDIKQGKIRHIKPDFTLHQFDVILQRKYTNIAWSTNVTINQIFVCL